MVKDTYERLKIVFLSVLVAVLAVFVIVMAELWKSSAYGCKNIVVQVGCEGIAIGNKCFGIIQKACVKIVE